MIDTHIHTKMSFDGQEDIKDIVEHCIATGCKHISITDHLDVHVDASGNPTSEAMLDFENYIKLYRPIKEQYKDKIDINIGVECGYTKENKDINKTLLDSYKLDYVINSVHEVDGKDCYFSYFYTGRTKEQSFNCYLNAVLESLNVDYHFDAIGHLGYVERTAVYPDKVLYYPEFKTIIDKILTTIIAKDKILEINTNVYGSSTLFMPRPDILKAYYDLGGRKITFSSDAHQIRRLGQNYDAVVKTAKDIGFSELTYISNGKHKFYKI